MVTMQGFCEHQQAMVTSTAERERRRGKRGGEGKRDRGFLVI